MGIVLSIIGGILVVGFGVTMLVFEPGRREALNVTVADVNFNNLKDGTYTGEYIGTKDHLRDVKVLVTVDSGKVTGIDVIGGALSGEKQNDEVRNGISIHDLMDRVIESQSLEVDVISGATISSKVHLKAVENALDHAE